MSNNKRERFWTSDIQRFKPGVKSSYVEEVEPLYKLLTYVKDTPISLLDIFDRLRKAKAQGNEELRNDIKSKELPFHTPSVYIKKGGKRAYKYIQHFNPVAIIEFDGLDNKKALKYKNEIFYSMDSCAMAWISPSGNGAKFLFKINKANNIEQYKEYWNGLAYIFQDLQGFDRSNINCVLPLFVSHDSRALYRKKPSTYQGRGYFEGEFRELSEKELKKALEGSENIPLAKQKEETDRVKRLFNSIKEDGFPQVRSYSLFAGGLFAGGTGEDEDYWLSTLEELIRSNDYLTSSGEDKVNIYLRTMKSAFYKGTNNPIIKSTTH